MANPRAVTSIEPLASASLPSLESSVHAAGGDTATCDWIKNPPAASAVGQVIGGRYELRTLLGRGGFGTVYLGWDAVLEREVAVKLPHADRFNQAASAAQLNEARLAAQFHHPGIVGVHDCGMDGEGHSFVVFEYVPGKDLAQCTAGRPCSPREAARLVAELATTLHAAHKRGLVHCDLKPANVLIDRDGRTRIADFGLAVNERTQRARKGEFAGTPAYMAPEQLRGEVHHCDGRTDIWALGVIFYELLTGRRPFASASEADLLEEIRERPARPPRQLDESIPRELEECCLTCLNKQVEQRFPTAIDVAQRLEAWLAGDQIGELSAPGMPALPVQRSRPAPVTAAASAAGDAPRALSQFRLAAAALVALLFFAGGAAVWWSTQKDPGDDSDGGRQAALAAPEPNAWQNLLAQRPSALTAAGEGPNLHWDAQNGELVASAGYPTLIQLGRTDEPNYQIRLTLRQHPWSGRVGLFLAYTDDPDDSQTSQFKLFWLERKELRSSDLALFRMVVTQEKAGRQTPIHRRRLAFQDVQHPGQSAAKLEIDVRDSRLERVRFGGQECPNLVLEAQALADAQPCQGPFGLYLDNSSVIVEKAEFRFIR